MSDIERRLASIEVMLEELASRPVPPHAEHHELTGGDTVRLSVQNSGSQLNRQRTLNFGAGLTASESSSNKRIDVVLADHDHTGDAGDGGVLAYPALTYYTANCDKELFLTTDYQDVSGATVTLAAAGTYIIWAAFQFDATAGASVSSCIGILLVDGSAQTGDVELGYFSNTERIRASVGRHWVVTTAAANKVAKLQAKLATANGSGSVKSTDTVITALRIA